MIADSWCRRLAAGCIFSPVIIFGASAQTPAPAHAPPAGFDVRGSPLTAGELAEELGYKFHGTTWHFSAPTYVRIKARHKVGDPAEVPEQPQDATPPEDTYMLEGPQREVTLHVLDKETDEADKDERGTRHHSLAFSVSLSGQGDAQSTPEDRKDAVDHALDSLLPEELADQATHTQQTTFSESMGLDYAAKQHPVTVRLYGSGTLSDLAKDLAALPPELLKPDAAPRLAAWKARSLADVEAKMLASPTKVYYCKVETRSDLTHGNRTKDRALFVLVLECSRQPFKDAPADADADADKDDAPERFASPAPSTAPSPAPAATSPR